MPRGPRSHWKHIVPLSDEEKHLPAGQQFTLLLNRWDEDTCFSSSIDTHHPAFREIVSFGPDIAPHIIELIRHTPSWIALALEEIFPNAFEFPEEACGRIQVICQLWIKWWEDKHPPTARELYDASEECIKLAIEKLEGRKSFGEYHGGGFSLSPINVFGSVESAIKQLMEAWKLNKRANKIAGVENEEWNSHCKNRTPFWAKDNDAN